MPTSTPPAAVFFDLDDTLLDHERSARMADLRLRDEYCLDKWSPDDFIRRWITFSDEHFAAYFAGLISFQEHRRRRTRDVFENPSISDGEADAIFETYRQTYESTWALFADAIPCLDELAGMRLGVISNGNTDQQRRKLKATGIDQRFEVAVLSSEIGMAKPQPGIFEEACRQLEVPAGECVMVGDSWERDVLVAWSAGTQAVWLCRNGGSGQLHKNRLACRVTGDTGPPSRPSANCRPKSFPEAKSRHIISCHRHDTGERVPLRQKGNHLGR